MVRTSLRRILAEPGASCNEAHVGTNGIGTALADGKTKIIGGPEHWGELHQDMTCVAAPIVHPVTRRTAGALNVTLMDQQIHPALTALVRWGIEEIRQGLLEQTGKAERLLFEQFMARRRSDRPSLLLSPASASRTRRPRRSCPTSTRPSSGTRSAVPGSPAARRSSSSRTVPWSR
ncbi:hypothetical protein ACFQV8_25255 [Pseudonocardia benzenivorans]